MAGQRRVKYVVELDTAQAERDLGRLNRDRGGGGGGGGRIPGQGGGGSGGPGGGGAGGGGMGSLLARLLPKAGMVAGAAAIGQAVIPGGGATAADLKDIFTQGLKDAFNASKVNSPFAGEADRVKARVMTTDQMVGMLGPAAATMPEAQMMALANSMNRINEMHTSGERRLRSMMARNFGGDIVQAATAVNDAVSEAVGINGGIRR